MNSYYEEKLSTERMLPLIAKMSLPAIVAQLVNLLYNIIDRVYIGHISGVGKDALAGIGITSSIILLVSAFAMVVGGGAAPIASIALGKDDRKRAEKILGNGVTLLIIFSVVTSALAYIFMTPALKAIGASDVTMPFAKDYLTIYLSGTLFVLLSTGLNTFISAQGRPAVAMISVAAGAVTNIALDPVFIFGLDMGVSGAALATVISQLISCILVVGFLLSGKASLRIKLSALKPDAKILKSIACLGISPFIMSSTESLVGFILNNRLSVYGDIYISALTVMQSAMQMLSVPITGFAQGVVPIISFNFGRKNAQRVKQAVRISMIVMFSFMFISVGLICIFPGFIARLFTSDMELVHTVSRFLPLFICGMSVFGLQRACQNSFVALGQAGVSVFIALLRKVILLVPLAIILSKAIGVHGVFAAEAIADATSATVCTIIFVVQFPRILKKNNMV